jgi:LPS O-antigen subunit length determinant protein (WzzB/FepE family)
MDDEIDLTKVFINLWEGKIKIVSSAVIALLIALGFNFSSPKPNFEATTEIKPLSSVQLQPYNLLNSYDFFKITPQKLLSLYLEQLEYKTLFVKAVDELGVLQKSDFETVENYNNAILRFVSNIKILTPTNDEKINPNDQNRYHKIKFTYSDQEIWKKMLYNFNAYSEELTRQELSKRFNQKLTIAKQKKNFLLEDIQVKKENVKKDFDKKLEKFQIDQNFKLEDIRVQIENVFTDYDKKILNRLAFLDEQKQIARKLGVAKNTIETQIFDTKNGTVANFKTDTPFYLRGYEAIEEEIKLLKNRDDKRLFINNLLELENKKRALEQDKTLERAELNKLYLEALLELENQERALKQDKTLERAENLFFKTPLATKDNFVVVNLDIEGTDFKVKNNKITILIVALFIGGFIGVFYVLISNAINNRKNNN